MCAPPCWPCSPWWHVHSDSCGCVTIKAILQLKAFHVKQQQEIITAPVVVIKLQITEVWGSSQMMKTSRAKPLLFKKSIIWCRIQKGSENRIHPQKNPFYACLRRITVKTWNVSWRTKVNVLSYFMYLPLYFVGTDPVNMLFLNLFIFALKYSFVLLIKTFISPSLLVVPSLFWRISFFFVFKANVWDLINKHCWNTDSDQNDSIC